MDTDRWKQICDLLHAVLERPEQEQEKYLRQVCDCDAALLEEVHSLLAAHRGAGSFLDAPAYSPADMPTQTSDATPIGGTLRSMAGETVSHYRVLSRLGSGGMGVVYEAEDINLGRRVAMKFLPGEVASDQTAFERMQREARSASALDHPNICSIYELGEHDGQPFIVMQLLEGETLREWIERTSKMEKQSRLNGAMNLAIQITRGLEAAHQKNIIHRDIKPENIFVTIRGEVKILDFGLAKVMEPQKGAAWLTGAGSSTEPCSSCRGRERYSAEPGKRPGPPISIREGIARGSGAPQSSPFAGFQRNRREDRCGCPARSTRRARGERRRPSRSSSTPCPTQRCDRALEAAHRGGRARLRESLGEG